MDNFQSLLSNNLITVAVDTSGDFLTITQKQFDPTTGAPIDPITTTITKKQAQTNVNMFTTSLNNWQAILNQFSAQS